MSKKISQEEIVVDFFQNGNIHKVETVNNIVKGIVRRRLQNETKPVLAKKVSARSSQTIIPTTILPVAAAEASIQ